jgi:cold-inducible RNA-binding protein
VQFGTVIGINIREDRTTGKPKGFGFVTFDSDAPAAAAIASMHGYSLEGRSLTVNAATLRGTGALESGVDDSWKTVPAPPPSAARQGQGKSGGSGGTGTGTGGKGGGKGGGKAVGKAGAGKVLGKDGKEHNTWDQWAGPVAKTS